MPSIQNEANYEQAKRLVIQFQNPGIAFLQRNLKLAYGPALALMGALEADGVVTPPDEHGYRRLTLDFEKTATEVGNCWRIFRDVEDAAMEGELLDVSAAVAAVRPYSPSHITFYSELAVPWIELTFSDVVKPETAINVGLELQHALQLPVYMANLQLHKVEYVIEGGFLLPDGISYPEDHFKSVRLPLMELAQIWNVAPAITEY